MDMHAGCKPPRLENVVRQYLVKKASESTRRYDVFHPSAWGYCLRKIAYQYYNEKKKFYQKTDADVNSRLEMIFDNGHHVHARWQDYLDKAGVLRGIWRCPSPECGKKHGEGNKLGVLNPLRTKKGWKCQCGNDKALEYEEIPIISHPDYNFRGSCDAVLDFRGGPFEVKSAMDVIVVDFKSMKNDEFVKLEHAKPEHIVQVSIYMWVLGLKGAVLLYESKNCVPEYARALTQRGWMTCDQLKEGQEILTFNPETCLTEWQKVTATTIFDFDSDVDGPLYRVGNKQASFVSTRNHRWYTKHNKAPLGVVQTEDLNSSDWIPRISKYNNRVSDRQSALSPIESEVLGLVVTDGWITSKGKVVFICQKAGRKADYIRGLLKKTRTEFSEYTRLSTHKDVPGKSCKMKMFNVRGELRSKLRSLYQQKSDFLEIIPRLSQTSLKALYKGMIFGDGSWSTGGSGVQLCQNDGCIKEGFQIICVLLGKAYNINYGKNSGYVGIRPYIRAYRPKEVKHKGKVWCPSVPNKAWVMEQNGKVVITGNTQLVKEMFVPRDEALIVRIKKEALWMRKLLDEGKLPPRNESFGRSSEPCLWCEFRDLCY
jgi:hypothetical protein